MLRRPFIPSISAIALAVFCLAQTAKAITIDWNSLTWTPGSISNSYDIDPSSPGNDITITIGGDLGTLTDTNGNGTGVPTPTIDSSMEGGASPVHPSLDIAANLHTTDRIVITVTFSPQYLQGVRDVSFTLFDVDQQTNNDEIHNFYAVGVTTGAPIAGTVSNLGSSVTLSGTGFGQVLDGTTPAANTGANSNRGNATVSFGPMNAIGSFTFTFENSSGAPRFQQIAIGDITFSPVPEINPTIAVASVCLFGMLAMKVSRREFRRIRLRRNRSE